MQNGNITIDADLGISLILEGYGGLDGTFGYNDLSWLTYSLLLDNKTFFNYIINSNTLNINPKIDFIYITLTMSRDSFTTDWADYGTEKNN